MTFRDQEVKKWKNVLVVFVCSASNEKQTDRKRKRLTNIRWVEEPQTIFQNLQPLTKIHNDQLRLKFC